jgi:hypothetical protein
MVTVTVERTADLVKPMGAFIAGKMTEGTIYANWGSTRTVLWSDVNLRSIVNFVVSPGTPLDIDCSAQVQSQGSRGNTVRIKTLLRQKGTLAIPNAPAYRTYAVPFTGTPILAISPGSTTSGNHAMASPPIKMQKQGSGSFSLRGSPAMSAAGFIAVGTGSYPVNFVAIGE